MEKQLVIIGIVAILITVGLSGCNSTEEKSTPEDKVIGDWISKTYYNGKYVNGSDLHYTFYHNRSCSVYAIDTGFGNWYGYEFLGQQLVTTDMSGTAFMRDYSFSSDNKQLVLSSKNYPDFVDFLERQ